jgi:ATP-dependent exoDNAse (exonuclease V) beta subunit
MNKKLKPFMTYLEEDSHTALKKFAKSKKLTMAKLLREGLMMRMSEGHEYINGFNDCLHQVETLLANNRAAQIRFPSGKTFAEMMIDEINLLRMRGNPNETA